MLDRRNLVFAGILMFQISSISFAHEQCSIQPAIAQLQVQSGGFVDIEGTMEMVSTQNVSLGRITGSNSFSTLNRMVFPGVELAFGQGVDLVHEGPTTGTFLPGGGGNHIDLNLNLKVTDRDGVSAEIPFLLTTRSSFGVDCFGPVLINGAARDSGGFFHLVGVGAVPLITICIISGDLAGERECSSARQRRAVPVVGNVNFSPSVAINHWVPPLLLNQ